MHFDLEFDQGSLPDDWIPLEAVIVLKGMPAEPDPDNEMGMEMFSTATKGLTTWEALGLMEMASVRLRDTMRGDD